MPHTFIAGVDLGATNVRVVIANEDGEVEARRAGPLSAGTPEEVLGRVARTIDDLVRGVWTTARAGAIGVALPGTVDPQRGCVASAANMPGWGDVPLADLLGGGLGIPVAAENDANAAAIGEGWLGAAKGLTDFVFVALGTGIGCGLWLGGRLHRGAHFLAGEAAFFPMTREHVRAPDWTHCLEGVAGGRALEARARDALGSHATAGQLFDAARSGEATAAATIAEAQDYLAMAIADMVALLDPQAVIVGGGVAAAQGEEFVAPIRDLVLACVPSRPNILLSSLGHDAQVLGAVKLALDRLQEDR